MKRLINEQGVALLSVLFVLVIVTMLATGAIMLATVQLKVTGSVRQMEARQAIQEGVTDYIVPLIQELTYCAKAPCPIPAGYTPILNNTNPRIDSELTNAAYLNLGGNDTALIAPNLTVNVGSYTASVDVDTLGTAYMAGGSIEQSQAYHKSAENQAVSAYRITTSIPIGQSSSNMCQVIWLKSII